MSSEKLKLGHIVLYDIFLPFFFNSWIGPWKDDGRFEFQRNIGSWKFQKNVSMKKQYSSNTLTDLESDVSASFKQCRHHHHHHNQLPPSVSSYIWRVWKFYFFSVWSGIRLMVSFNAISYAIFRPKNPRKTWFFQHFSTVDLDKNLMFTNQRSLTPSTIV